MKTILTHLLASSTISPGTTVVAQNCNTIISDNGLSSAAGRITMDGNMSREIYISTVSCNSEVAQQKIAKH